MVTLTGVVFTGVLVGEVYGATLVRLTLYMLLVAVTFEGFDTMGRM